MDRRFTSAFRTRCWIVVFAFAAGCGDSSEPIGPPNSGGSGGSSTGTGTTGGGRAGSGGAPTGSGGASGATSGSGGSAGATGGKGGSAGSAGGSGGASGSGGTAGGAGAGGTRADAGPGSDASVDAAPPPCTGDRCICMPGERRECYSGPAATKGVGLCVAGTQTCDATGTAWGMCTGEVVPRAEDCASAQDEDCDGRSDCFIVDLRADVNRNGTVDLADPTEDTGEDTWDATHGAVFLPNIDDDANTCSKTAADAEIAKCNDAADEVTNGNDDLLDLARVKTVPAPSLPADASGSLTLDAKSAALVRVFKKTGTGFTVFKPTDVLTAAELKEGVEFGIEGKDVQRDATWNGYADVTLTVKSGGDAGSSASDTVRLRQAPLIFRHHLSPVKTLYAINSAGTGYTPFANSLTTALTSAGGTVPFTKLDLSSDQWAQDMMEPAYVAMPGTTGPQVIKVNVRSANYGGSKGPGLRPSGRAVFTQLRGKDVGGVQHYDPNHANNMDTLNSTGNFETIPPYTNGAESFPLGRVLRGRTATWYPDKMMDALIDAQGQQNILAIDTSWLLVGHVDETVSFMKAATPHGFIMLVTDPAGAIKMLQDAKTAGNGSAAMFSGTSGATTIDAVLANTALMTHNQDAAADILDQVNVIKTATGLTDAEIVKVPITHRLTSSKSVAHLPGTVNGIALSDKVFFAPEPHGPVIGGKDIFKAAFEASMTTWGITVYWVEDWDLFHALDGEIHCATNVDRVVGAGETWWTSGK